MANLWYPKAIQHFGNGDINWASNTIKVALISSGYTLSSSDEFYSVAVSGGNIVSAGQTLGTKMNVGGLLSAANTTWSAVTGSQVTQLVGYVGGTPGSGDYILFNDSVGANLPVTPNGGNITATWDAVYGIGTLMAALDPRERSALQKLRDMFRWRKPRDLWLPEPSIVLG